MTCDAGKRKRKNWHAWLVDNTPDKKVVMPMYWRIHTYARDPTPAPWV
jgi:hypothetical protein